MTQSFVNTVKREYVADMPKPDRETALRNLTIASSITASSIRTAR